MLLVVGNAADVHVAHVLKPATRICNNAVSVVAIAQRTKESLCVLLVHWTCLKHCHLFTVTPLHSLTYHLIYALLFAYLQVVQQEWLLCSSSSSSSRALLTRGVSQASHRHGRQWGMRWARGQRLGGSPRWCRYDLCMGLQLRE